jgi:hypothetical protein
MIRLTPDATTRTRWSAGLRFRAGKSFHRRQPRKQSRRHRSESVLELALRFVPFVAFCSPHGRGVRCRNRLSPQMVGRVAPRAPLNVRILKQGDGFAAGHGARGATRPTLPVWATDPRYGPRLPACPQRFSDCRPARELPTLPALPWRAPKPIRRKTPPPNPASSSTSGPRTREPAWSLSPAASGPIRTER